MHMFKSKLIAAGILLSAVGYIGYLTVSHVVNSVRDEAEKLRDEKEKEETGRTDNVCEFENADQPAG